MSLSFLSSPSAISSSIRRTHHSRLSLFYGFSSQPSNERSTLPNPSSSPWLSSKVVSPSRKPLSLRTLRSTRRSGFGERSRIVRAPHYFRFPLTTLGRLKKRGSLLLRALADSLPYPFVSPSAHDVDYQDVRRQLGSVKCFLIESEVGSNAA